MNYNHTQYKAIKRQVSINTEKFTRAKNTQTRREVKRKEKTKIKRREVNFKNVKYVLVCSNSSNRRQVKVSGLS